MRRGVEAIRLWHCSGGNGSPGCFDSGLQVICIVGSGVSHLPLYNTPYILYGVQVRRVCWPIKHSNTMVIEPAFGTFSSVCRCQVLLENEIYISIKLVSRRKHEVLYNCLVDGCIDCGLQKTQVGQHQQMTWQPKSSTDMWKLHTGLQATWILCLSSLPPDSGTLISKLNAKFTFFWKEDFGTLNSGPVHFLLSPGTRYFWRCFCFRSGLVALFLKMSERGDSWFTDSSFSSLLVKLSQVFESALIDSILKLAVIPVACAHFPTQFLPVHFAFNMLWYSTSWTATPFSNDPLWLTLFVEGVNDRLLDHCQVSSIPHYCGFKEQEIPRMYTVWLVIYWNSNVNILIFWDNVLFLLSLAVSSNHQN